MNWIDLILIVVILFSVYSGWRKGFINGMLQLISWVLTLIFSFLLYKYLADFLQNNIKSLGIWATPLAFLAMVFIFRMVFDILFTLLTRNISLNVHFSRANKVLGIIPGALAGFIYAALFATIFMLLPWVNRFFESSRESIVATFLTRQVDRLETKLSPVLDKSVRQTLNKLTVEPGSSKTIELDFTVSDPAIRSDLEREMLVLLNRERIKAGLKPFKADPDLVPVARAHSLDMFQRGYFSHITPEGKAPSDRIRAAKVPFITAGENLALAQTLGIAHNGLMNSPGHRANILHPAFRRVGIGILDGGPYGIMVTQNFRN
ncbi:MAG TPA: CvpA family protein [Sphingobacteriaceae bacterium]